VFFLAGIKREKYPRATKQTSTSGLAAFPIQNKTKSGLDILLVAIELVILQIYLRSFFFKRLIYTVICVFQTQWGFK
jgi:hypothetical protein